MQHWLGVNTLIKEYSDLPEYKEAVQNELDMAAQAEDKSVLQDQGLEMLSYNEPEQTESESLSDSMSSVMDSLLEDPHLQRGSELFSSLQCIDLEDVLVRLNNNAELLKKLLEKYYDTYVEYFEQIRQSYEQHQYRQVSEMAHKIKGASRSLGINRVGDMAEQLELSQKEGIIKEGVDYPKLLNQLQAALFDTMVELAEFFHK